MKLRSIRVREVARFHEQVELSGLQPGLNLLVGENEAGKSTLFKALNAVFTESYATKSKKLEAVLRPYSGGAPRIEVEFDIAGTHYRLIKQFFAKADAELVRLPGNVVIARGGEVDPALAELFDNAADAETVTAAALLTRLNLLWLDATHELASQSPAGDETGLIKSLVGQQAESIASSETARDIRHNIHEQLSTNLTKGGIASRTLSRRFIAKNSPLYDAMTAFEAAEERGANLRAEIERLTEHQRRYTTLLGERDGLGSEAELEDAAKSSAEALASATQNRARLHSYEAELATLTLQLEQAQDRHDQLENAGTLTAKLQEEKTAAAATLSDAAKTLEELQAGVRESRKTLDGQDAEMAAVRAAFRVLELAAREASATDLAAAVQQLDDLEIALAERATAIDKCPLSDQAMTDLRAQTARLAQIDAALEQAATTVTVHYDDPSNPDVKLRGSILEHDVAVALDEAAQIDIPGAVMRIEPGGLERGKADRAGVAEERDSLLAAIGVPSFAAAEALWQERNLNVQQHEIDTERYKVLAPNGRAAIETQLEALRADISEFARGLTEGPQPTSEMTDLDRPQLQIRLDDLTKAKAAEITRHENLQREAADANAAHATATARVDELSRQLEQQNSQSGALDDETRAAQLSTLAATIAEVGAEKGTRASAVLALRAATPDDNAFAVLETKAANAQKALEDRRLRARSLDVEIATLTGVLQEKGAQGLDEDLAEAEAELADAEAAGARMRATIEELFLLDDTLHAVEAERHAQLVAPLQERMGPYLETLFAGADLTFDDTYQIETVERAGQRETLDRLSSGTREQIAIIARLAYARLMADAGLTTPLILDDAMVFSDDVRIAQMFAVLEEAAQHHQIIILTCRENAFAELPAHRVAICPTTPHIAAAE